jgi:hypothetical protein
LTKFGREIMDILEVYDLTRCAHSAAVLAGCDPKTVAHWVAVRDDSRVPTVESETCSPHTASSRTSTETRWFALTSRVARIRVGLAPRIRASTLSTWMPSEPRSRNRRPALSADS